MNENNDNNNNYNNLPLTVGILIFDQVELLDVAGPFEVFSVTRLNQKEKAESATTTTTIPSLPPPSSSPFKVLLIAEELDQISTIGGLRLSPDASFETCSKLDLLIVPGGWGTRKEVKNDKLVKWIADKSVHTKITASVCTGSSLLGKAGLLDGRESTTHFQAFDFLHQSAPKTQIRKDVLFTLKEPVFTSAGVSAGIDLALRIVSHFFGIEVGIETARHMEYPYPYQDNRRRYYQ
jgi:transcriptional regulator GlxA family with amidase domain